MKTYLNLRNNALKIMSLYRSTYTLYLRANVFTNENCQIKQSRLADTHLENALRIASSPNQPQRTKLVKKK